MRLTCLQISCEIVVPLLPRRPRRNIGGGAAAADQRALVSCICCHCPTPNDLAQRDCQTTTSIIFKFTLPRGLPVRYGAAEPVPETRRADTWVIAGGEAL